jgi:3-oxoacyl-[acyl-carrier protein] reductase
VAGKIAALGQRSLAVRMDVTDRASVEQAAQAAKNFGAISILVNNAGINKPTDFDQVTEADWDRVLDANLKGPFTVAQVFLPLMKAAGGGAITHISSVSGQYGGPRTAHYAASKAGLISLAQVIARFGAPFGVRSNTVAAGLIASDMAAGGLAAASVQKAAENIILKRMGTSREVADAVVFLSSDAASYITAQTLNVNGGLYF